jgi:glyoxylase-like metal-dependent hydrolase (beta-lactamase superfamily II)
MMRLSVSVFAFLFASISAVWAGQEIPDYPVQQVSEHVYVIHGPREIPNPENRGFMNNPAFVITDQSVVVVDPGSSVYIGEMVLRQIRKITDRPVSHVFISHIHGDHWLGSQAIKQAYPQVKIYAHPEMIAEAKGGGAQVWLDFLSRLTEGATDGTQAEIPTEALQDGREIAVGGLTFRVYLAEHAHTKTDAMIEVVEDSLMFLGDIGVYQRMGRMDDGSFRGNIAALDRALALGVKHYVPGHGPSGGPEAGDAFRQYLKIVYDAAAKYSEEGLAPYEIKAKLMPLVGKYREWPLFEEDFGKQVSLAVLEAEQAAF